jgi:hypothetical protein
MATFHFTFSVLLQRIGGRASGATPFPVGPRQCAQFSARNEQGNMLAKRSVVMANLLII